MVAVDPIDEEYISSLIDVEIAVVQSLVESLNHFYDSTSRSFFIAKIAGGYQLRTRVEFEGLVESYASEHFSARLSGAALEALSIVAYRQPLSRTQVSSIRGVNSDSVIKLLTLRGYIAPLGRDPGPGQAVLYGTTQMFLERLGLFSLGELPPLTDFIPSPEVAEAIEAALRDEP